MTARDTVLWGLLAWLWGSSFLAIGVGVHGMTPLELVVGRMGLGALILVAVLYGRGGSLRLGARGWALALLLGATGNFVPFLLISFAEQRVDSGLAALIMGVAPVVTVALAPLVHAEESLGPGKIAGAALGFAGILVLVGPEAARGLGGDLVPQLALVAAALCYAGTALLSRRFAYPDPIQMAAGSVLTGALAMVALLWLSTGQILPRAEGAALWAMLYLGVGPTAAAALIYFSLIPRIGAGRLQQVNYVVPVVGLILGALLLGERPSPQALAAIPMILLAVVLVTRRA